jgi:hypothetical protein
MVFFGPKHKERPENFGKAKACLVETVRFLKLFQTKRGVAGISAEEAILERKLVFLLDDLRIALKKGSSGDFEGLIKEINQCSFELWEESAGRRSRL